MLKVDHGSQNFSLFCLLAILQRSSSLCSHQYRGQPPPRAWRQVPVRARPASRPPAAATALDGPGWSGGLLCARPRRAYKQYRGQPPPPRDAMGLRPARAAQAMPALMAFAAFSACAHLLPPRCRRRRSHFAQQWNYCLACQTQFFGNLGSEERPFTLPTQPYFSRLEKEKNNYI